jgi:hypothetical protein
VADRGQKEKASEIVNRTDRALGEAALKLARFRREHVVFENHCITNALLRAEHEKLVRRQNQAFAAFQAALTEWAQLKKAQIRNDARNQRAGRGDA